MDLLDAVGGPSYEPTSFALSSKTKVAAAATRSTIKNKATNKDVLLELGFDELAALEPDEDSQRSLSDEDDSDDYDVNIDEESEEEPGTLGKKEAAQLASLRKDLEDARAEAAELREAERQANAAVEAAREGARRQLSLMKAQMDNASKQKDGTIRDLEYEVKEREAEVEKNAQTARELAAAERENTTLNEQLTALRKQVILYESEGLQKSSPVDLTDKTMRRIKRSDSLTNLYEAFQKLSGCTGEWEDKLAFAQQCVEEREKAVIENKELSARVRKLRHEVKGLKAAHLNLGEEMRQHTEELQQELDTKCESFQGKMDRMKKRLHRKGQDKDLEEWDHLENEKEIVENALLEARKELNRVTLGTREVKVTLGQLQTENANLADEMTGYQARIKKAEKEAKEVKILQKRIDELEGIQELLETTQAKLKEEHTRNVKFAEDSQTQQDTIDQLTQDYNKLKSKSANTAARLSDELQQLTEEKAELEKGLVTERQKVATMAQQYDKDSKFGKQMESLKQEVQELTDRLAEEKATAANLRANVANLTQQNQEMTQTLGDFKHTADKGSMSLQQIRDELKAKEEQCATLEEQLQSERQRAKQLQKQLDELAEAHEEDRRKLDDRVAEAKRQAERDVVELKANYEKLLLQKEYLAHAIRALHAEVKAVKISSIEGTKKLLAQQRSIVPQIFTVAFQALQRTLARTNKRTMEALKKYNKEIRKNRVLYNQMQDLKGSIRVYSRVRPLTQEEMDGGAKMYITFPEDDQMVVTDKGVKKSFTFDRIFAPGSTQTDVFLDTAPLISSVLDGYNVCIFAYGQTGSGKTYTMEGPPNDRGVNFLALIELFKECKARANDFSAEIKVSLVEIYNEQVRDLLHSLAGPDKPDKLEIKQGEHGIYVPGLVSVPVACVEEVAKIMQIGSKNRSTGRTNANAHSSRSHALVMIEIATKNLVTHEVVRGKLTLVDLAGSERVSKSGATDERLLEAQNINRSLSALGDVIQGLVRKDAHIPYRNSKLTYLLADSLGGDSKTLMFVQINPHPESSNETVCSLQFASRVKNVELGPATRHVAGSTGGAELQRAKAKIKVLEEQLTQLAGGVTACFNGADDEDDFNATDAEAHADAFGACTADENAQLPSTPRSDGERSSEVVLEEGFLSVPDALVADSDDVSPAAVPARAASPTAKKAVGTAVKKVASPGVTSPRTAVTKKPATVVKKAATTSTTPPAGTASPSALKKTATLTKPASPATVLKKRPTVT
eukprot:TRINITY_DN3204_c0_g1_i1.p1 TRINITY_DN3204_c0_g1~~TRINITY_DN3204_c0_g1_i1.p1  ORF type:complete len:1248 (-),score=453.56 TRINITY_DN3204_c0_g1_i1:56-3799(-)